MTKERNQSKGFYEAKGMVRHVVILTEAHKTKLKQLAKTYNITQGEVVEVLLDLEPQDRHGWSVWFEAKRDAKHEGKTTKTDLAKKVREASPETLAAIQALLNQDQGVSK